MDNTIQKQGTMIANNTSIQYEANNLNQNSAL